MTLLVGTDHYTQVSSSSGRREDARRKAFLSPTGLRHAVPESMRVALCGAAPDIVWRGRTWPGLTPLADRCHECSALVERQVDAL